MHDKLKVDAVADALVDMRDRCYCHSDDTANSCPMVAPHTPPMALCCSFKTALVCGRQRGEQRVQGALNGILTSDAILSTTHR